MKSKVTVDFVKQELVTSWGCGVRVLYFTGLQDMGSILQLIAMAHHVLLF
jgi:hypothetical protein